MANYKNIVVLTGAGISAESGIRTFRAEDGLWEGYPVEQVATPEGYAADPLLVQTFYNERREQLNHGNVEPNAAHYALAELEKSEHVNLLVVTQNVDNLHEKAGTKNLIHMHGELNQIRCENTGKVYHWTSDITPETKCDCCNETGTLRPNIVWFGEMPFQMEEIYQALSQCDLFISIGTSGHVYPAAGFVEIASQAGVHTVELNLEPSLVNNQFKESINGAATQIVPKYLNEKGYIKR